MLLAREHVADDIARSEHAQRNLVGFRTHLNFVAAVAGLSRYKPPSLSRGNGSFGVSGIDFIGSVLAACAIGVLLGCRCGW